MPRPAGNGKDAASVHIAPWSSAIGSSTFSPFHEINERCIELLARKPRHNAAVDSIARLALTIDTLRNMRPELRQRAAKRPFLLVDFGFSDAEWWSAAKAQPTHARRTRSPRPFSKHAAIQLARAALIVAWHVVRSEAPAARLLMGMTARVAEIVETLTLEEIDRIAEHQFGRLRPRWEDQPHIWRSFLSAARSGDSQALRNFDVHAIQLISSEMIPHCQ